MVYQKTDYSKIKHRRYHSDIYLPEAVSDMVYDFFQQFENLGYTTHAIEEMYSDRFGRIPKITMSELLDPNNKVIELYEPIINGELSGYIQKILIRATNLSKKFDYSYIVAREGFVVSAWANLKNDYHKLTGDNSYFLPQKEAV